ncbi:MULTISPECIES: fused MFS/spermidine synthase [Mycolicibacterium]|uniref:Fused MFS/spermidine synthase n=1 Tax=Mycolicibacterium austroafricanum TaxID=39687 RepID=A0ABT8H9G0_MYCAO|nr:fused MFS/spermidine synthase [Mycolicibacterium austroafricanum]MDN4517394.1 fused MFS/spermidine synthase [Mycolicibacterium austroafricanum]
MTGTPPVPEDHPSSQPLPGVGAGTAAILVFTSSAAVLVVEITALRLLAPYLGLTLETSTLVIGIALAAIALGSWAGGRLADRDDPRRWLGTSLGVSGVVVAFTPSAVRAAAEWAPATLLIVATLTILAPGALLSAVTPMVTKLRLIKLAQTGTIVGQLSGVGTMGAIAGTVLTGFVFVSRMPVSVILIGLGSILVLGGIVVESRMRRRNTLSAIVITLATVGAGLAGYLAPGGCDVETKYHCARVIADPERDSGRTLTLDGARHSYIDLQDPALLQFIYVRAFASVVDASFPSKKALEAYHLGGGGLTFPRYLAATRPGSHNVVSEIDGGVVRIDRDELGSASEAGIEVRVEDGRLGLAGLDDGSRDLIVGDAFGGVSVPWHLTTVESLTDIRRVLKKDGVYVANLIDYGELAFARAEVSTLTKVFDYVIVAAEAGDVGVDTAATPDGGNLVVLASDRPVDPGALQRVLNTRKTGWTITAGDDLRKWIGDARVLTDDYAPVDQLLDPYRRQTGE